MVSGPTFDASKRVDVRRGLPAIGAICDSPAGQDLALRFGRDALVKSVQAVLSEARARLSSSGAAPSGAEMLAFAGERLEGRSQESLFGVINATGIVIHTNLGRAPLAPEASAAMAASAGYGNLEFDLASGCRVTRHGHLEPLITELTGAEAGFAVNNCAGAVLLALGALASPVVIVSRGELVEIGGGFRVPDIVRQSGSRLVEVGTTNCTHLRDYEAAIRQHPEAKVILRTHRSNFRISGFTSAPSLEELVEYAHSRGLLVVEDLGGGALVDLTPYGIVGEPTVAASLQAGADLVVFSGDKLLGGPQAGLIAGKRLVVAAMDHHPLARALRIDKLSLAALAATLRLYRAPSDPLLRVPVLRMLTEPLAVVGARAAALAEQLAQHPGLVCDIIETEGFAGGGAMPMLPLSSRSVAITSAGDRAEALAQRLRTGAVPVVGRIERDRVLLDMRTVADGEVQILAAAVRAAVA